MLSLVWKKLCFYFLAQVVFIAKHDTSASASSEVILCLPHWLSGHARVSLYTLRLNSMYISCPSLYMHTSHPQWAIEAVHYHLAYQKNKLNCKLKNKECFVAQSLYTDSDQESSNKKYVTWQVSQSRSFITSITSLKKNSQLSSTSSQNSFFSLLFSSLKNPWGRVLK